MSTAYFAPCPTSGEKRSASVFQEIPNPKKSKTELNYGNEIAPSVVSKEIAEMELRGPLNETFNQEISSKVLNKLSIIFSENFDDITLQTVLKSQPSLEILNIEGCSYGDPGLVNLANSKLMDSLKILDLSYPSDAVSNDGIGKVVESAKRFEKLILRMSNIENDIIIKASSLETLKVLDVSSCDKITDAAFTSLSEKSFSTLTSLDISSTAIGGQSVHAISHLPNLDTLNLSGCQNVGDEVFSSLPKEKFSAITSLDISSTPIGNRSVHTLSHLNTLQVLDLSRCRKVTDEAFSFLSGVSFSAITSLNISDTSIGDKSVHIIAHWNTLKDLNLSDCQQLTDNAFVLSKNEFPNLARLDLARTSITNKTIARLANDQKFQENLVAFDISGSKSSESSLRYFSQFRNLQRLGIGNLDLGFSPYVSDQQLSILTKCSNLTHLDIDRIAGIESIFKLVPAMKRLQFLYAYRVNTDIGWLICPGRLNSLRSSCPQLTIISCPYASVNRE